MSLHEKLKSVSFLKIFVVSRRVFFNKYGFFKKTGALISFFRSYSKYKRLLENKNFLLQTRDLYPRLFDNTKKTLIDPVYFYQDTWCAGKIFSAKPKQHYDVGSSVEMVGILSQFVPTIMIDIRPLPVTLPNLSFSEGSVLSLPFADNSIEFLSSICVIEHIGLGRYGDSLDQYGSEKAAQELIRVLLRGGSLYISVPIDKENVVYFNAHRAFTREYVLKLFKLLTLVEEKYVYGSLIFDKYEKERGFGTGLFHFKK
jgi:SAM-dependent methyltransferase